MKRRINQFKKELSNLALVFPDVPFNGYWELHLPGNGSEWLNSVKTPLKVQKQCIQELIDKTDYLIKNKPDDRQDLRVLLMLDFHYWYSSKIEICSVDENYKGFSPEREDEYTKWVEMKSNRNLVDELGLVIPNGLKVTGIKEEIKDKELVDEDIFGGEIWFIHEIK
ncbi:MULTISPECIES: DUF3916 domain-containing protein [unclassified Bacillus (in: firmicutes)]|uniref:DUF3916 domain-containing protein n=1 Tax=unclassified Bacillus (in: firmicutes) TaxID=185979 RepID=UPI00211D3966|nr:MULTISPECIES: DUF3916 domain-containing protein [unclassified Bacillus (in: firmicutes)]